MYTLTKLQNGNMQLHKQTYTKILNVHCSNTKVPTATDKSTSKVSYSVPEMEMWFFYQERKITEVAIFNRYKQMTATTN